MVGARPLFSTLSPQTSELGLDDTFMFQASTSSSSSVAFWVERFTPEGDVYYEDVSSGRTTWARPPEFELVSSVSTSFVWERMCDLLCSLAHTLPSYYAS